MREKIKKKLIVLFLGALFSALLTIIYFHYLNYSHQKQKLRQELIFWKQIVSQHPEYPDGWAKLATIWYYLREEELARLAIEKARKLDPVREELKILEKEIEN